MFFPLYYNFLLWPTPCTTDRAHGNEFSKQFEDSCVKLEDFVGSFEKGVHDRKTLITALEEGELFYQAQFGEARIVANVSMVLDK